ncbi:MAG: hypothetical protein AAGF11_15235 [Myxococcota bacterium]
MLAVLYQQAPSAHAAPQRPKRERAADSRTSSALLSKGEALVGQGKYARGAAKYEEALRAMDLEPREADVGAPAAILASRAYWMAFEADGDIAHLQAAINVLEHWRKVAGPDSKAIRLPEITRRLSQLYEIANPVQDAYQTLETRDYEAAATHFERALDAAIGQQRTWSAIAQLTLRTANANVSAFEAVDAPERTQQDLQRLEQARGLLQLALDKRPSADTDLIRTLQQRLEELEELEAAERAEQAEQAKRAEQAEQAKRAAKAPEPPPPPPVVEPPPRRNVVPSILISTGSVVLGSGVGLVVTGFVAGSIQDANLEDAEQHLSDPAQRDVHYENVRRAREYEQETMPAYRSAMFISGSVLAAGGLAIGTAGLLLRARARTERKRGDRRAQLGAIVSRAQFQLSLTTRF